MVGPIEEKTDQNMQRGGENGTSLEEKSEAGKGLPSASRSFDMEVSQNKGNNRITIPAGTVRTAQNGEPCCAQKGETEAIELTLEYHEKDQKGSRGKSPKEGRKVW